MTHIRQKVRSQDKIENKGVGVDTFRKRETEDGVKVAELDTLDSR